MSRVVGYKCKLCKYETSKRGWRLGQVDMEEHFRKQHKEDEVMGNVETIEAEPRKLWTCPNCQKEMSYHLKHYHTQNYHRKIQPKPKLEDKE